MLCLIDEIKGKEGKRFKIHIISYSITYKVVAFFFFFSSPPPPRVHGRSMNQRLRTHSKELIGMASCSLNLDYTGLIYLSGLTGRRYLMG